MTQIQSAGPVPAVICVWARTMLRYHHCAAVVMPYREVLHAMEEELCRLSDFAKLPAVLKV